MRRILIPVQPLLLLVLWAVSQATAATVTAELDQSSCLPRETVTLSLRFEGGEPSGPPILPNIPNLQVQHGGRSEISSVSIVNGRVSRTANVTHAYALTPLQPGEYVIPPLQIEVQGQQLTTSPLKLTVLKSEPAAAAAQGTEWAFMNVLVPKTEVYLGENFPIELRVYVVDGQDLQIPQLNAEGFVLGKMAEPTRKRVAISNRAYNLITFTLTATAVKAGQLNLGPAESSLKLRVPRNTGGQLRRFGLMPFGFDFELRPVTLSTDPQPMTVLPLPADNVPPGFNGAVGQFSMKVTASRTNVTVGDPIALTIQIAGKGALDPVRVNAEFEGFKTYPPAAQVQTSDPLGLGGVKTIEQMIAPEKPGIKQIPPIVFSYFDPDKKAYATLTHPAIPLNVQAAAASAAPLPARPAAVPEPARQADIVHIKTRPGLLAHITPPMLQRPWFWALQAVPLLGWIAAWLWRLSHEKAARNPRLQRQRQVSRWVRRQREELRALAQANRSEEFFGLLFRILQEQLGERLDLPASAITEAVIEERLRPGGMPAETVDLIEHLFQACNMERYAPQRSQRRLMELLPEAERAIEQLRNWRC